jgi:hypothetical protein
MKPATSPITTPRYGHFESCAARFTDYEAWVFDIDRTGTWREMNAAEVLFHAGVMTKAKFEKAFRRTLPPLPKHAFTKLPNAELKARIDDVNARARALYGRVLENYSPEWRKAFKLD